MFLRCFLLIVVFTAVLSQTAYADSWRAQWENDRIDECQELLLTALDVLQSKDPEDWTDEEIDDYLFSALFSVYYAVNLYIVENRDLPVSSSSLR